MAWPLRPTQIRGLFPEAWQLRVNLTFSDAMYVELAKRLGADLLTDDQKLANSPNLPVRPLHLLAGR